MRGGDGARLKRRPAFLRSAETPLRERRMPNPLRPKLTAALIFVFAPLFVAATIPAAASSPSRARPQDAKPVADADAFGRAKRMLEAGDAAGAAAELKSVAEARKTDADAWYLLGVALGRAGDAKGARGSFE